MSFPESVKFCILGISVCLLLLALGILAWQFFRCCTQTQTAYTQQDTVLNSDLQYSEEKPRTAGNYAEKPSIRVQDLSTDIHKQTRCLSQGLFTSLGSSQEDGDMAESANIQQVDGSLRFSIYYDQLQSRLVVTVLQVEGLLEQSQKRSPQPFVKLTLMRESSEGEEVEGHTDEEGDGVLPTLWTVLQEWRTRIVKGSYNPLFGDQFSCILQDYKEFHHITLRMEVRDFDKFSRHKVLGEVRVPLGQLNLSNLLEFQEDLQITQKDLVGEVLLSLKFLPTSQRLEVGLLKIKMFFTEICSDKALYARVSLQCNNCKLKYQKTSSVPRCLVTVFNEVLMFSLPNIPLEQCKIFVSVYETHMARRGTKHLIGQLTVGKEKNFEDKHWRLMMQSVRQPMARWHGLLI